MQKRIIMIGSDIEVPIVENNRIVSAEGKIGGTKEQPLPLPSGRAVQEDNVMLEFNTLPVTLDNFAKEIQQAFDEIINIHQFEVKSSHHFSFEELSTKQAQRFGCEPDYCVWDRSVNKAPLSKGNLRTCGGHIHISYENPNIIDTEELVKAFDLYLGVPSILIDRDKDRRLMYGKAGAFRIKPYGFEYRTLSNFWLANNLSEWIAENIKQVFTITDFSGISILKDEIISCINNGDEDLAKELIEQNNITMPQYY